nr:MAG TPA: Receptor Binding Protein [Caudoviricetes sp.]
MTKRVFNMGGGAHSDAAYTAFENAAYGSCVANVTSLAVSAGSGMSVRIAAGDAIISTPSSGKRIQSDAIETVTISAANATYPRIDSVVVYIDSAVQPTTAVIDNVNGILKFAAVAGTPAASPTAPTESMIQAAIGAGNRYMVLADVKVPNGATSMNTATFTDRRKVATMIDSSNLAKKAVKAENIDFTTMPDNKYTTDEQDTGQKWIDGRPIYRKVVRGTVNMTGGYATSSLPHGIQGLSNRWELIRYYGNMRLSGSLNNNPIKQALPYIEGTHQSGITSIDQTNITISGSYAWGSSEVSVVLEYVK